MPSAGKPRTYFVPICILGVIMFVCGLGGMFIAGMFESALSLQKETFRAKYEGGSSYGQLYEEAAALREELSFEKKERAFHTAASGMFFGAVLVWWAIDRRRLMRARGSARKRDGEEVA